MKNQRGYTSYEVVLAILGFAMAIGWGLNVVKFVSACCEPVTGMLIARVAGFFLPPLGAVLGYL